MIPILLALAGLVFASAGGEFWRRARWIDRLALVAFIALAIGTRPGSSEHEVAVGDAIIAGHHSPRVLRGGSDRAAEAADATTRLSHCDLLVVSFTRRKGDLASVGAFGRVFVLGRS